MQLPYLRVVHYLRVERGPPRRSCWVGQNPAVRVAVWGHGGPNYRICRGLGTHAAVSGSQGAGDDNAPTAVPHFEPGGVPVFQRSAGWSGRAGGL